MQDSFYSAPQNPPATPLSAPVPQPTPAPTPAPKKKSKLFIIIFAAILIIASIIIAIVLLSSKIGNTAQEKENDFKPVEVVDDYITVTIDNRSFILADTFGETAKNAAKVSTLYKMNDDFKYEEAKDTKSLLDSASFMKEDGKTRIATIFANASAHDDPDTVYADADAGVIIMPVNKLVVAIDNYVFTTGETSIDEYIKPFENVTPPNENDSQLKNTYIINYKGHTIFIVFNLSDRTIAYAQIYKNHPYIHEGKKLEDINIVLNDKAFVLTESYGSTIRNVMKSHGLYQRSDTKTSNLTLDDIEAQLNEPYNSTKTVFYITGAGNSMIYSNWFTSIPPETVETRADGKANAEFVLTESAEMSLLIDGHLIKPGETDIKDLGGWIDNYKPTYGNYSFVGRYKDRYIYVDSYSESKITVTITITPMYSR